MASEAAPQRTQIRLIPFSHLQTRSSFPRYPDDKDHIVLFEDIDYDDSLVVFVSHNWLRGHSSCAGWDGRPHPDTANNEKLQYCIEAISRIWRIMAPAMKNCYVWVDFGCINQDSDNPALELEHLDQIMQVCDCVLSPIVDEAWNTWDLSFRGNLLKDYYAAGWIKPPWGYLHRAWCRMEMLYAAFVPLLPSSRPGGVRYAKFARGIRHAADQNRRQHFLFGSKEYFDTKDLLCLPPLWFKHLDTYNPEKGHVTNEADRAKIRSLMQELLVYGAPEPKYSGPTDSGGQPHIAGELLDEMGNKYVGSFRHGKKHGRGILTYCSGDRFEGQFKNDRRRGSGVMLYGNGNRYEGNYDYDRRHGTGIMYFADGGYYAGSWYHGLRSGFGVKVEAGGDIYAGYFLHDKYDGRGMLYSHTTGDVFESWFKEGQPVDRERRIFTFKEKEVREFLRSQSFFPSLPGPIQRVIIGAVETSSEPAQQATVHAAAPPTESVFSLEQIAQSLVDVEDQADDAS